MKVSLTAIIFLTLLCSPVASMQIVEVAMANPFLFEIMDEVPPDNSTYPPTVVILSPSNNASYAKDDLVLSIDIEVGYSATATDAPHPYISEVYYRVDYEIYSTIIYKFGEPQYDSKTHSRYNASLPLDGLTLGNHTITVFAVEKGRYESNNGSVVLYYPFTITGSSLANFTIENTSDFDSFNIIIKVESPQNITYNTNDIPLSFSYDTNIINSPRITNSSVVFLYNIDEQLIFDVFGNLIFTGETTRIGQFYQPVPLTYNSSIHVPDGNHSLFVVVAFWIYQNDIYPNTFRVLNVSQVFNFTVYAETPTSTPSQSPSLNPSPSPSPSSSPTQTTSHYGPYSNVNPASFDLTIYSPDNQAVYADIMLLKFNITWIDFVDFPFPVGPPPKGDYSYSIDDGPRIAIESNQSSSDQLYILPAGNFTINPTFSNSVDISSLENGYHKIVIIVGLYRHSDYYYVNQTSVPIMFLIQNPSPSPSPTNTPTLTPETTPPKTPNASSPSPSPSPSPTIPEYQTWIILSLLSIITLLAITIAKRKKTVA